MMEWISVKDRLPEKEKVLYLIGVEKTKEQKELNFGDSQQDDIGIAIFEDGEWCGTTITFNVPIFSKTVLKASHWMPLPEAPKE